MTPLPAQFQNHGFCQGLVRTSKDGFAGWARLGVFGQSLVSVQFESQPNRTLMEIPMKNAYKAIFESGIPITSFAT